MIPAAEPAEVRPEPRPDLAILRSGWSYKKGAANTAFKPRFLVLYSNGTLAWFSEAPSGDPLSDPTSCANGFVDMKGATIRTNYPASTSGRYCLKLLLSRPVESANTLRTYASRMVAGDDKHQNIIIEFTGDKDRDRWASALQLLAERQSSFNAEFKGTARLS